MNRKRGLIIPLLLITLTAGVLFAGGQSEPVNPATLTGELVYLEGEVWLNNTIAEIGTPVKPGDAIKTGIDGLAEVTFGKRNILHFGENTQAVINQNWGGVNLDTGSLGAVLNGLAQLGFSKDNRFQVKIPTAALGIRGTSFFIQQPDKNETYFCTCYGQLQIDPEDGSDALETEAYHHAAIWLVRTPDGFSALPSGLHYHDDASMAKMARQAGTSIHWRD